MNTKTLNPALVAVQMQEWPDSVILTDEAMLKLLNVTWPDHLRGAERKVFNNKNLSLHQAEAAYARIHREVAEYRAQWARGAFLCRMSWPDGFFYACGKRDGTVTYRHIGFRFGTEPCEYMSGFGGMTYTPEKEQA